MILADHMTSQVVTVNNNMISLKLADHIARIFYNILTFKLAATLFTIATQAAGGGGGSILRSSTARRLTGKSKLQ